MIIKINFFQGTHWKKVRSVMTPTFSSGKIRAMTELLRHSAKQIVQFLDERDVTGKILKFLSKNHQFIIYLKVLKCPTSAKQIVSMNKAFTSENFVNMIT